jgi:hypothetical protein
VYQFVFNFLVPLYKTAQKFKSGFQEMNDRMNSATGQPQNAQQTRPNNDAPKEKVGEYIDFEEIK